MQHTIMVKAEAEFPINPKQVQDLFSIWLKDQWKANGNRDAVLPVVLNIQVVSQI